MLYVGNENIDFILKFKYLIWVGFILPLMGWSQVSSLNDFLEDLYEVTDSKRLSKIKDTSEELDRYYFSDIDVLSFNLAPDRRWRLMFAKSEGWREIVGQEAEDLSGFFLSEEMSPLTGKEITEMFGLRGKPTKVNPTDIQHFSNERFEEIFVMRAKNQPYAVVVYVHSYANGNITSLFSEMRYYFMME